MKLLRIMVRPLQVHHMALDMFVTAQDAKETCPYVIDPKFCSAWQSTCLWLLMVLLKHSIYIESIRNCVSTTGLH